MTLASLAAALASLVLAQAVAPPTAKTRELVVTEHGFAVRFPGEPTVAPFALENQEQLRGNAWCFQDAAGDQILEVAVFLVPRAQASELLQSQNSKIEGSIIANIKYEVAVESGETRMRAAVFGVPEEMIPACRSSRLPPAAWAGLSPQPKLLNNVAISIPDGSSEKVRHPGIEIKALPTGGAVIRARLFVVANRIFEVLAISEDKSERGDVAFRRFADSFRLVSEHDANARSSAPTKQVEPAQSTYSDAASGLAWQAVPPTSQLAFGEATKYCRELRVGGLADWRLPTLTELRTLIRGCPSTEATGNCMLSTNCTNTASCLDKSCDGCTPGKGPANGCYWPEGLRGECGAYWSSSSFADGISVGVPFPVVFYSARVGHAYKTLYYSVRCVRPEHKDK